MKKIVGIGFSIPSGSSDDYLSFDSLSSLSDYDIAIFNPDLSYTSYEPQYGTPKYDGETLYDNDSSNRIKKHFEHWKKEIDNFLESGKNVFINLCPLKNFYVYSGSKDYSGTGRNQKVTHHISPKKNYDFLPVSLKIFNSSGKIIVPTKPIIKPYFDSLKTIMKYEAHISNENINSFFSTKNKDKILGASVNHKKGNLIFLPYINFDLPQFTEYDKDEVEHWTDEALKTGKIYINHIVELNKTFKNGVEKTQNQIGQNIKLTV